jgi:hypothetical protein
MIVSHVNKTSRNGSVSVPSRTIPVAINDYTWQRPTNKSILMAVFSFWFLAGGSVMAQTVEVLSTARPQSVFNGRLNKCGDIDIPDSPARAMRSSTGMVVLIASHYENQAFGGLSFDQLHSLCESRSMGALNPEPAAIDDRYWVQALLPTPDGQVLALVSHEYMGHRHPSRCAVPQVGYYPTCWYSTIAIATGSAWPFKTNLAPLKKRVMAASPHRYDPNRRERTGFFTVSNIVRRDGYVYVFSYHELPEQRGNCLFRAQADAPLDGWLALSNGNFSQSFPSPYDDRRPVERRCDPISPRIFSGPIRSVVWVERLQLWMAVSSATGAPGQKQLDESGVFYSLSKDLVTWEPRRRLFAGRQPWGQKDCAEFFEYPSLIDHGSMSDIFDTVDTDQLFLYLTRFNYATCNRGLNRDLVRIRLNLPER